MDETKGIEAAKRIMSPVIDAESKGVQKNAEGRSFTSTEIRTVPLPQILPSSGLNQW